jgi:succinate-semialdehyde dehydrogenase/glutarate-semialdehyde dehydrogenase
MTFHSINPANGEPLQTWLAHDLPALVDRAQRAQDAWTGWRDRPIDARAQVLRAAAAALRADRDRLARRMALEVGKPLTQGLAEVDKCAWVCDYYADHAADMLQPEPAPTDAARSYVAFAPLGPILAIMPWNFPLWQVFRCAAPALMAGNVVLLKHAPNAQGCAEDIAALFAAAGLPDGCFTNLRAAVDDIGALLAHPAIRGVALTGGERAGRAVGALAGAALKPAVLELGGSDPAIILEDADLALAARECALSRLLNTGQSCIAAKRLIVVDDAYDDLLDLLQAELRAWDMGDPLDPDTRLGPMAREDLRDALHAQVQATVAAGARCLLGGHLPPRPGAWYPATLLTDIPRPSPAWSDELFGPVAAVFRVKDEAQALRVAQDTRYGLGASIFTADRDRGERLALALEAGACFVNAFVRSDPRLPFGGVKDSGFGRELGRYGLLAFANVKAVYLR